MNKPNDKLIRKHLCHIVFLLYWFSTVCFAEMETRTTETRPDGTVIQSETVKYYPPEATTVLQSVIIGTVVVFGGFIALFGIRLILRALELGHHDGAADIDINASTKSVKVKKITQGSIVTLIGAGIMLGALYFLTL